MLRKWLARRRFKKALRRHMESGEPLGCQHVKEAPEVPQGHVNHIDVQFPEWVEMTEEDERAILEVVSRMCERYEAKHPDRVMWPCGVGGRPQNIWSDEDFNVDMSVFSVDVSERENYDWACQNCSHPQGEHSHSIIDGAAGDCVYKPALLKAKD